jgi:hypothetical protein
VVSHERAESPAPVAASSKRKRVEVTPPQSEHRRGSSQHKRILRKDYSRFFFDESLENDNSEEYSPADEADSSESDDVLSSGEDIFTLEDHMSSSRASGQKKQRLRPVSKRQRYNESNSHQMSLPTSTHPFVKMDPNWEATGSSKKNFAALSCSDDAYTSHGQTCAHGTAGDPKQSGVDRSCTVLTHFKMYFHSAFGMIVCEAHKSLIPFAKLQGHVLESHKKKDYPWDSSVNLRGWLKHVQQTFQLSSDQDVNALDGTKEITEEIPGLPTPEFSFACITCHKWLKTPLQKSGTQRNNMRVHVKNTGCQLGKTEQYRSGYTISVLRAIFGGTHRILASYYDPNVEATLIEKPLSSLVPYHPTMESQGAELYPQYFGQLGWSDFLRATSLKSKDIASLVRLPSKHVDPLSSPQRQSLERGLYAVHEFLRDYLQTASDAVNSFHGRFREQLTLR